MPRGRKTDIEALSLPSPQRIAAVRRRLLAWYDVHQRRMPWRAVPPQQPNPYDVLVSEAMLQQTQVATVIPYFERFIDAFPTVHELAASDEQAVLNLWQGLGYYRRARNLRKAAQVVVDEFGGQVPATVDELMRLPGVGRYCAGAVASIAHGTPAPIVDGNVKRVLARLDHLTDAVDLPAVERELWALAEAYVAPKRAGDFNQAVMELGATVCTPTSPGCAACPLATLCEAKKHGDAETLPKRLPKRKPKAVTHTVVAIERRGAYLFEQRPNAGLWSNMWQLATHEDASFAASKDVTAWVHERYGLHTEASSASSMASFKHQTTHRTITFQVWRVAVSGGRLRPGMGEWRRLDQVCDLPLAKPQGLAIAALQQAHATP